MPPNLDSPIPANLSCANLRRLPADLGDGSDLSAPGEASRHEKAPPVEMTSGAGVGEVQATVRRSISSCALYQADASSHSNQRIAWAIQRRRREGKAGGVDGMAIVGSIDMRIIAAGREVRWA